MAATEATLTVKLDAIDGLDIGRRILQAVSDRLDVLVADHRRVCGVEGGAPEECCVLEDLPAIIRKLRDEAGL